MKRMDLSIGQRLALGFGGLLTVLSVLVGAVYHWHSASVAAQHAFTDRIAPLTDAANQVQKAILTVGVTVRSYLLTPTADRLERQREALDEARAALSNLAGLPKEPDGQALFRRLESRVEQYFTTVAGVVGTRPGAVRPADELNLLAMRSNAEAALEEFIELQGGKQTAAIDGMVAAREKVSRGVGFMAGIGSILFLVLAVATMQAVRVPARELVGIADEMRQGNWNPALVLAPSNGRRAAPPRDELRRVRDAFGTAAVALEQREQRLRADRHVAAATASSLSKETVATVALQVIADHVGAEVGVIYMTADDHPRLVPVARRGVNGQAGPLHPGEGLPGQALQERRLVCVRDIPADTPFAVRLGYDQAPPRAVVAVPLAVQGEPLGVLLLSSLRDFDESAVTFLEAAGTQLGVGLQNVRAYERNQRLLGQITEQNQQIQAQNEELQAQNEELQAQNEEIQAQTEEIQAQNEELQAQGEEIQTQNDQLKQQQDQLIGTTEELQQGDARKNEFLAFLAHELRNPLAAITSGLQVLAHAGRDAERATRARQVLERQARQLNRLIDDLLDLTRISRGKIELRRQPLDLRRVIQDCVTDAQAAFQSSGILLRFTAADGEITVNGDAARLVQVVGNLLDNAAKFSDAGATVSVSLQPDGSRWAELHISDTGVGIDPRVLPQLFQPFAQGGPSGGRRNSGLGLGLALVKTLVELHDGSVTALSEGTGQGARFVVRLPLLETAGERAAAAGEKAHPPGPSGPYRILLVEDNTDAAVSLRDLLELSGHEIHLAHTAADGLSAARRLAPDIVLCDLGLPDADGYSVATAIRADQRLAGVLLVALSGFAAEPDRRRALDAGFDHHVGKPATLEQLNAVFEASVLPGRRPSARDVTLSRRRDRGSEQLVE